jgi:hypothetical protein
MNLSSEFKNILSKKATLLVTSIVKTKKKTDIDNCLNITNLSIAKRDLYIKIFSKKKTSNT